MGTALSRIASTLSGSEGEPILDTTSPASIHREKYASLVTLRDVAYTMFTYEIISKNQDEVTNAQIIYLSKAEQIFLLTEASKLNKDNEIHTEEHFSNMPDDDRHTAIKTLLQSENGLRAAQSFQEDNAENAKIKENISQGMAAADAYNIVSMSPQIMNQQLLHLNSPKLCKGLG